MRAKCVFVPDGLHPLGAQLSVEIPSSLALCTFVYMRRRCCKVLSGTGSIYFDAQEEHFYTRKRTLSSHVIVSRARAFLDCNMPTAGFNSQQQNYRVRTRTKKTTGFDEDFHGMVRRTQCVSFCSLFLRLGIPSQSCSSLVPCCYTVVRGKGRRVALPPGCPSFQRIFLTT